MLKGDQPALLLAPMEGVLDAPMRAVIAEIGGFDFAVSEFVRVSREPIRARAIARQIPELRAGLPIQVQLLGHDPKLLAETAIEACAAGAKGIDLNFGCPSPTVIRHHAGSALLKNPALIGDIVAAVRHALPAAIAVSAKIRLGWTDPDEVDPIARAAADAGADWIVIHARTREELYRPGVHWEPVRRVAGSLKIPVVANGDLFSVRDIERCADATGCRHFMIGRGVLLDPFLGLRMRANRNGRINPALPEPIGGLISTIRRYVDYAAPLYNSGYLPRRIKQWIGMVRMVAEQRIPRPLMTAVGKARTTDELLQLLDQVLEQVQ